MSAPANGRHVPISNSKKKKRQLAHVLKPLSQSKSIKDDAVILLNEDEVRAPTLAAADATKSGPALKAGAQPGRAAMVGIARLGGPPARLPRQRATATPSREARPTVRPEQSLAGHSTSEDITLTSLLPTGRPPMERAKAPHERCPTAQAQLLGLSGGNGTALGCK